MITTWTDHPDDRDLLRALVNYHLRDARLRAGHSGGQDGLSGYGYTWLWDMAGFRALDGDSDSGFIPWCHPITGPTATIEQLGTLAEEIADTILAHVEE